MAERTTLDKHFGIVNEVVSDPHEPGRMTFATTQDVSSVIDLAKQLSELPHDSEMRPVAEIPMVIVEGLMQSGAWYDPAAMRRWLNDPQNECFRVWRGRL